GLLYPKPLFFAIFIPKDRNSPRSAATPGEQFMDHLLLLHPGDASPEKIPTTVFPDSRQVNQAVAAEIASLIKSKAARGEKCVLGLATGSTPTGVYDELVRLHKQEGLSFKNVVTFNLDEYYPMQPRELQSYRRFMQEHLFDHVDVDPKNVHIPDGTVPIEQVNNYCKQYEQWIVDAGGIDLQILG